MFPSALNLIFSVGTIFIVSGWAITLTMIIILPRRQRPEAARAWLIFIFFIPWLGLLFYLIIGENRLPGNRRERHAQMVKKLKSSAQQVKETSIFARPHLTPEQIPTVTMVENLGKMPILDGNDMELISGYDNIIDRLIADIDTAEHHIHMLFYIIADDETGRRTVEALVRAVKRGVTCRVLVDSFGVLPFIKKLGDQMIEQGIELHYILPISLFRRFLTRIDLRNHRKIAIIDGRLAYTGSQNIINSDYGYNIEGLIYEELMVRLTGPIVVELQSVFVGDWYIETEEVLLEPEFFPKPVKTGSIPIQALPSGPTYKLENFQRIVIALLHDARERIVITTPYFIPDEPFIQAVQTAVLSGVEVNIIVSAKVDQAIVGLAQSSFYEELLQTGVNIFIYGHALLHAKHLSVDNTIALIGSGNMDRRSFDLNFEISMLFYNAQAVAALRAEEARYIEKSEQLQLETWLKRPGKERFLQDMAKLVSPLL